LAEHHNATKMDVLFASKFRKHKKIKQKARNYDKLAYLLAETCSMDAVVLIYNSITSSSGEVSPEITQRKARRLCNKASHFYCGTPNHYV